MLHFIPRKKNLLAQKQTGNVFIIRMWLVNDNNSVGMKFPTEKKYDILIKLNGTVIVHNN